VKLVVGLGNVGTKYHLTRHNIGFLILDELADRRNLTFKHEPKLEALVTSEMIEGRKVIYAKPTTYVNLSGNALTKLMNYYKIAIEDVIVIYDDINLDTGIIRIRETNGHGGHNGVKSIIEHLKTKNFKRIRVGIGLDDSMPLDHYVLGNFSKKDIETLKPTVEKALDAIELFSKDVYFKDIMTKHNSSN